MVEMMRLEMKYLRSRCCFIAIVHAVSISVPSHHHHHHGINRVSESLGVRDRDTIIPMHAWLIEAHGGAHRGRGQVTQHTTAPHKSTAGDLVQKT